MDRLAAIRRLYYEAKPATVARDLSRAVALLKAMETEDERERAAVYMDGLSQMRTEWAARRRPTTGPRQAEPGRKR